MDVHKKEELSSSDKNMSALENLMSRVMGGVLSGSKDSDNLAVHAILRQQDIGCIAGTKVYLITLPQHP